MSGWQDRVNGAIVLQSPSGQLFVGRWKGDRRTKKKKLGIFSPPKARGAVVQDLDVEADEYPITFYFDGPDHDLEAKRFWGTCNERGTWDITHPVNGNLTLQLISVSAEVQPVTDGNITRVECEWIEVGLNLPAVSVAQLEDDVTSQIENVQAVAADQFAAKVKVDKPSRLAQLKAAVLKVLAIVDRVKGAIAGVNSTISAVRQTVLGLITAAVMVVASLAGAITSLVMLPGLIIRDIKTRFRYFEKIIAESVSVSPKIATPGGVNSAAVHELVVATCICGLAQAAVDAEFSTREEAISYLGRIEAAFTTVVDNLDAVQTIYAGSPIDRQYFSQSDSWYDMAELLRGVRELLLRRSFDLAVAKRVTLRQDRAPIEIALTEGVDFDLFISSNNLKGDEILLLPTGRTVVVYL